MNIVLQKTHSMGLIALNENDYEHLPQNFVANIQEQSAGSMSMKNLWWSWMGATADYMAASGAYMPLFMDSDGNEHGKRRFNKDDAHELFTSKWMGTDNEGKRYSWKVRNPAEGEKIAPKSKRLYAMEKHQAWCSERGIKLLNPEDSEFRKLQLQQEK